jgi:Protein of unknown function (DUF4238)
VPTFQRATDKLACLVSAKQIEFVANDPRARSCAIAKIFEQTGERLDPDEFHKTLTAGSVEITQENRGWSMKKMFDTMLWLQEFIFEMGWTFLISPDGDPGFLTSDNPVSLFDPVGGLYGGGGIRQQPRRLLHLPSVSQRLPSCPTCPVSLDVRDNKRRGAQGEQRNHRAGR